MNRKFTYQLGLFIFLFFSAIRIVSAQNWVDVNSSSLSGGRATNHTLTVSKTGTPYIGFSDASLGGRAVVRRFDGTNWVSVGTGSISTDYAHQINIAVDKNNIVYLSFIDAGLQGQAVVKKFENNSWVNVGSNISNSSVDGLSLVLGANGLPFVAFTENGRIIVKSYNGTTWTDLSAPDFFNSTSQDLSLIVNKNNVPYVAYTNIKTGKLSIRRFENNNWVEMGFVNATGTMYDASLTLDPAGNLYVLYREFRTEALHQLGTVKVKKFNGSNWEELGTSGFSTTWVFHASLSIDRNNTPYVAYRESDMGLGNPGVTKVKRFNGREWEEIGTGALSSGPVKDVATAMSENGILYLGFADFQNQKKAVVLKLDLPSMIITIKAPSNLALAANNDTGSSSTDQLINIAQPVITGLADANARVTVYLGDNSVGTTNADAAGNWTYRFTVPLLEGNNIISATATDAKGNSSAASASLYVILDQTAPVLSGVTEGVAYNTDKTITFNDGVALLNQEVINTGAVVSAEGAYTIVVSDFAGNNTSVRFSIIKTPPVATLTINNQAGVTNSNQAVLSITGPGATQMRFSDDNTAWTAWETMANTRLWTLSAGSGSKWVRLQVRDAAGNISTAVSDGINLDQVVPTVVLSTTATSPTSLNSIPVKLTFSENVTGLTANTILVTNANKGTLTGSGRYYTLQVLPTASATVTISVNAGIAQDGAGNKNVSSAAFSIAYVKPITAPVVTSSSVNILSVVSVGIGGNVTSTGGSPVTERGIVYSVTSTSPSVNSSKVIVGTGLGSFNTTLANLKAGVTYYARAYASNAIGTSYGAVQKFTVAGLSIAVTSTAAKTVTEAAKAEPATLTSFPNPFQSNTTIEFTIPTATDYTLQVFDMNGNLLQNLQSGKVTKAERLQVNLDGSNLKKGIYLVRLTTAAGVQNLKLVCNN